MPIAGGGPGGPVGCTGPPTTGGGGIGGATPPVLLTVVDVRCCFVEDRLDVLKVKGNYSMNFKKNSQLTVDFDLLQIQGGRSIMLFFAAQFHGIILCIT